MSSFTPTTVIDPLTTVFTPPAWCSTVLNSYSSWGDNFGTFHALQNGNSPGLGAGSLCWPPNFYNHNWYTTPHYGLYSPGVCPSGYTSGSKRIFGEVTRVQCCPGGFLPGSDINKCKRAATGPFVVAAGSQSSTTVNTPFIQYAWPVQVAWRAGDLGLFTPASAPILTATATLTSAQPTTASAAASRAQVGSSTSTVSTSTSTSTSTSALTGDGANKGSVSGSPTPAPASGLPTGAKVGIGVGVGLGCVLIVVLIAILSVMLRKRRNEQGKTMQGYGDDVWRVQSTSTGTSSFSPRLAAPNRNPPYKFSEMDQGRSGRRSPYLKPELDAFYRGYSHQHHQAELDGS